MVSCGNFDSSNETTLRSAAARVTGWENESVSSMRPVSSTSTLAAVVLCSSALTVRCAVDSEGRSTLEATWGKRTVTGPLFVR